MRCLVVACLLVSSVALADSKAVEAVVKKNITGLASLNDDDQLGLNINSVVIESNGSTVDMSSHDGCVSGAVANAFYGCNQASITHELGAITVGVDDAKGIAWFQAPYTAVAEIDDPGTGKPSVSKDKMRVGGIAIRKGKSWEIATEMFTALVSDKTLLAGTGGKVASGAPKLAGDTKLAGVVAAWFPAGFAAAASKTGTLIASGTGSAEFKTGAAATKLAASFDKLKIGASKIEATVLAGGAIGWVVADVAMPRKSGKGAVDMKVAIIVVPDGTGWRWVSFQYLFSSGLG